MKAKLLVTGASGFLGKYLFQQGQDTYKVIGQSRRKHEGGLFREVDLCDETATIQFLDELSPNVIIHCAANSNAGHCEKDPVSTFKINVTASKLLAEYCSVKSIPFVFCSTDLVFNGKEPVYSEQDVPDPLSNYGRHKVEVEQFLEERYPSNLIVRLPLMYGKPGATGNGLIKGMISAMRSENGISLFEDEFRTPVCGKAAANGILHLLKTNQNGLYHLGGKESINRMSFGLMVAKAFRIPHPKINACLQSDLNLQPPRPQDVSLDSQKAFNAGYNPPLIEEELKEIAASWAD